MNEKLLLEDAITHLKQIKFVYNNFERLANPHHIGILHDQLQIHAYQVKGGSVTGNVPGWKNFKISKIFQLCILESNFAPEKTFHPQNSHYSRIFKQVMEAK